MLVLPQRPYLPDGSLREAIAYPLNPGNGQDARIRQLLVDVGLQSFVDRLSDHAHWQNLLSLGEQQRLTIVRAILLMPDWLFLDEATSSLDETSERRIYDLLRRHLPQATIVSVGHRSSLRAFHTQSIDMMPRRRDDGETLPCQLGADRSRSASAASRGNLSLLVR
jgi:putative ATP-binding cassette transporter